MARALESQFDYAAAYEVVALERTQHAGETRAYSYPGTAPVLGDQELADGPILEVRPANRPPWIGVFYGGDYEHPPAAPGRLIGWPDGVSLCVVWKGGAVIVRSDDPSDTYEIEPIHPITGVFSVPEHEMTLFADFTHLAAYGADGLIWTQVDRYRLVRSAEEPRCTDYLGVDAGNGELVEGETGRCTPACR
jgi:hypothetical protein